MADTVVEVEQGIPPGTAASSVLPVADLTVVSETVQAGVLTGTELVAEYTLRQPAPRQWVAVGVVKPYWGGRAARARMLVGRGTTQAACLGNLARRVAALGRHHDDESPAD